MYTRSFLYSKLKEISKDILPEKNISQTVTTNMEELVTEIKDYDSKRKSEFSEIEVPASERSERPHDVIPACDDFLNLLDFHVKS